MNNLGDYLNKKAEQLDLGRDDELAKIQQQLDEWFPGMARAKSLNKGVLRIQVTSSSVANELRFKTNQIKEIDQSINRVVIR